MNAKDLSGYWSPEFVEVWLRQMGCTGPIKKRMGVPPLRDRATAEAYGLAALAEGSEYVGIIVQYSAVPGSGDTVKWLAVWVEDEADDYNAPDDRGRIRSARSLS